MRSLSFLTPGIFTCTLGIAACGGGEGFTGPDQSPSFSSLSVGTPYTVSLTCNAPAANSVVHLAFYQGTVLVGGTRYTNNCQNLLTVSGFDNFTYDILVFNSASDIVKECTARRTPVTRTGKFACKQDGLSAVLAVKPY
jgi:hypothetical protein